MAEVRGPAAGLAAASVALGVAELVSVFTGPRSAPLVAVGGVVVDSVPEPVKEFATSTFGTHDKTALLIGTTLLLGVFAALVGWVARRDIGWGMAGIGLFGAVGILSALTRAGAGPGYVFPSLLGAATGAMVLNWLLRERPEREGRRRFITETLVLIGGSLAADLIGRQLGERKNVNAARQAVTLPTPSSAASDAPQENVNGASSFVTPNADFYRIDTALSVPQVDPEKWNLRIHGQVSNPYTITYADLLAMPMIERYVTLACVSNDVGGDLVGNARWLGVPVKSLLERALPKSGADQVIGRSVDGFTTGTPTEVLLDGRDAMLAVGMNGEPLPIEHGFPVRMVVPGLYGYVSATKWITELELSTFAQFDAYWVPRGWSQQAPIKTESRIDTPRDGSNPRAGTVNIAGVAWAQHRGISKVEVRVDGGDWHTATLGAVPSIDTWRLWSYQWQASKGTHTLSVRATDNGGDPQTADQAPVAPNGATGYHTIQVVVS